MLTSLQLKFPMQCFEEFIKKIAKEAEQRKFAASKRTSMSKEEFLQKAREDAYAAEGDRIADAKQKQIEGIENARMYSARRAQEEEQIMAEEVKFEKAIITLLTTKEHFFPKSMIVCIPIIRLILIRKCLMAVPVMSIN